jgi:hypothetical protein
MLKAEIILCSGGTPDKEYNEENLCFTELNFPPQEGNILNLVYENPNSGVGFFKVINVEHVIFSNPQEWNYKPTPSIIIFVESINPDER